MDVHRMDMALCRSLCRCSVYTSVYAYNFFMGVVNLLFRSNQQLYMLLFFLLAFKVCKEKRVRGWEGTTRAHST